MFQTTRGLILREVRYKESSRILTILTETEGKITGTAAKMFVISGPVIVYGVTAGAVYGLILWIAAGM